MRHSTLSRLMNFLAAIAAALALAAPARATVPSLINFQGKLLDRSNNPRNGTFNFTFKIYDSLTGGTLLWNETQTGISVNNGVFSVQLGAATPIPTSVFSNNPSTYLEITVGSETGSPREALVTSPYAFKAASVDGPLPAGDSQYVQVTQTLQAGATFYVSSATVAGPLTIGGIITAGSGNNAITTAAGLLDAGKLSGTVPSAQLSGTYSNALTLSNTGNSISGDGTGLTNVTAAHLAPGDTNYVQIRGSLQAGATFYVSSGTVAGPFVAAGAVKLGGTAGVNDVTVTSNLTVSNNITVSGSGPQNFGGNIQINGNGIQDSAGNSRITLGDPMTINTPTNGITVPSGQNGVMFSTSVFLNGTPSGDNYVAFPFTAQGTITAGNVVVATTGGVQVVATNGSVAVVGFAVNSATAGGTVWVAMTGLYCEAVSGAAVTTATRICTSSTAAGEVAACTTNGAIIGKAVGGTTAAGQTFCVAIIGG